MKFITMFLVLGISLFLHFLGNIALATNGELTSMDKIFTKVSFEGNSISVWYINTCYYVMPLIYLNRDSIKYTNASAGFFEGKNVQFEIILMTDEARKTVLNHLRQATGKCIVKDQVRMFPIRTIEVSLMSPYSEIQLKRSWNVTLKKNQDSFFLNIVSLNIWGLYYSMLQNNPVINAQFTVKGNMFQMGAKSVSFKDEWIDTDIEEVKCKPEEDVREVVKSIRQDVNIFRSEILDMLKGIANRTEEIFEEMRYDNKVQSDCSNAPYKKTGIYQDMVTGKKIYCDMESANGGWTVIMRRQDGSVDFTKSWVEYKNGFGYIDKDFWLGNEYVHQLTTKKKYQLRIEVWDKEGQLMLVELEDFKLASESEKYTLSFENNIGDIQGISYHNKQKFTTYDQDNDEEITGNCARNHLGGWWFRNCYFICLTCNYDENILNLTRNVSHVKRAVMMIR